MPISQSVVRRIALLSAAPFAVVSSAAFAQTTELPAITVTQTRLFDRVTPSTTTTDAPRAAPSRQATPAAGGASTGEGVTTTAPAAVSGSTITGASTTIITAEDVRRSPAASLVEIIAQVPGVQITSLFGGVNGVNSSVDIRGFGATASSNTLVLINGRRLNDLDLAGVDFSTIPRDSIERIEVTRGNSGAVLYGDNGVGGVINIVTKTGAGTNKLLSGRIEFGAGSFNQKLANISTASSFGPWSTSAFGNFIHSDGYRDNNRLTQKNGVGDIRYTTPDMSAFLTLSVDDQALGLPGARLVSIPTGINQLVTDRRGTSTPYDNAAKQGASATAGFTKFLMNGVELIVDGGVRDKLQQGSFFGNTPLSIFGFSAVDADLLTWSITPRLRITNPFFGLPSTILTGIDYYDTTYRSDRSRTLSSPAIHRYNLAQDSVAAYYQQTVGILPSTDISYGGRVQRTHVTGRDTLNAAAPGYFGDTQASPLDSTGVNTAYHVGIEHRVLPGVALFGRAASAFRTPNVDERVASGPSFDPLTFDPVPRAFNLKTQTSNDLEAGFKVKLGRLDWQTSVYTMNLKNEIQFDAATFFNRNLDPTRRYGSETFAAYRVADDLALRGGVALTRSVFRDGPFAGNDVPLVSHFTANAGVSWNIYANYLVFDATARFWSSRRMANDSRNFQPVIPADATVDLKLSGQVDRFFWSASVNNLFDAKYYDYAVASATTFGRFNAYPLPGRNFLLKAGMVF